MSLQAIKIATLPSSEEACLVFANGQLVAIFTHLQDRMYGDAQGYWYLEAAFGRIEGHQPLPFPTIDDAKSWIKDVIAVPETD